MQDVIDPLPHGATPRYDLSKNDMVFYLETICDCHGKSLGQYDGCEALRHIECPLHKISIDELFKIREKVSNSVMDGKIYASCICDGGNERGRGIFFVATKGTILGYK
jgi:hypothetical protein